MGVCQLGLEGVRSSLHARSVVACATSLHLSHACHVSHPTRAAPMSDVDVFAEGTAVVAELEAIAAELELTGAPDEEEAALHPPTDEESRSAQRGVQVATALAISLFSSRVRRRHGTTTRMLGSVAAVLGQYHATSTRLSASNAAALHERLTRLLHELSMEVEPLCDEGEAAIAAARRGLEEEEERVRAELVHTLDGITRQCEEEVSQRREQATAHATRSAKRRVTEAWAAIGQSLVL